MGSREAQLGHVGFEDLAKVQLRTLCRVGFFDRGEAKSLVKGVSDAGFGRDGFKALLTLHKRYDCKTQASLLQAYLEVVNPAGIKGLTDICSGYKQVGIQSVGSA